MNLEEIEARANAATPGPWEVIPDARPDVVTCRIYNKDGIGGYCDTGQITTSRRSGILANGQKHIVELAKNWGEEGVESNAFSDAEFIAHARTDIPFLLSRLRELEEVARPKEPEMIEGCELLDRLISHCKYKQPFSEVIDTVLATLRLMLAEESPNLRPMRAACERIAKHEDWIHDKGAMFHRVSGEWHITNRDCETWETFCLCGSRDYFPEDWHWLTNGVRTALSNKRQFQAYERYMAKQGDTREHRLLLAKVRWEVDYFRGDWVSLFVQGKRPMGNSAREYDFFDALGRNAYWLDENGDGDMPDAVEEEMWDLFDELPFALHDILKPPTPQEEEHNV